MEGGSRLRAYFRVTKVHKLVDTFLPEGSPASFHGFTDFFSWVHPICVEGILDFRVIASLIQKKAVILWPNFTQGKNDEIFSLQMFAYHAVNERASSHLGARFAH